MAKIAVKCSRCRGYGILIDIYDLKVGNICRKCSGTGKEVLSYELFEKRLVKKGIRFVQVSPVWTETEAAAKGLITYKEFLKGKRPTLKRVSTQKRKLKGR